MRIAWCTPFASASAIGRFSALVVTEMRNRLGWDVDIFYPEGAGGRLVPDRGTALGDDSIEVLATYDCVVYNLGNHAPYHADLVTMSRSVPGIAVLHDLSLTHLMLSELIGLSPRHMTQELRRWYGAAADGVAEDLLRDPGAWAWNPQSVESFSLVEMAIDSTTAVVTHSAFAADRLRDSYAGDIWHLPLPALHFDVGDLHEVEVPELDGRALILQAGVLNQNKRVPTVVEAFAQAGISDRAQLVICGYAEPRHIQELTAEVAKLGLGDSVRILGPVSDTTLHALRQQALIATVLRDPCTEAASAVLLDSMAYGLAVVTVDIGHYRELPPDTRIQISSPPRAEELAEVFRRYTADPELASTLGGNARRWVTQTHTPAVYADRFVEVVERAGALERRRDVARDLAETLRRVGFGDQDPIMNSVAATAAELFGPRPRRAAQVLGLPDPT